jgi:hypothetical protein
MPFAHHACDHPASRLLPPPVRPRGPRAPWRHLLTGQGDPHTPPSEQPTGFVQHNKIENEFRESANASSWPPDRGPHRSRNVGQIAEPPRIWTATPQLRTGRHRPGAPAHRNPDAHRAAAAMGRGQEGTLTPGLPPATSDAMAAGMRSARCAGADAGTAACLPEEVERDLGCPIGLRIDAGFASHILKLAGPAGDHSHRWVGEHGRGVD